VTGIDAYFKYNADFGPVINQMRLLQTQANLLNQTLQNFDKQASSLKMSLGDSLASDIGKMGGWNAKVVELSDSVGQFGKSLEKQELTLKQYAKEGIGAFSKASNAHKLAVREVSREMSQLAVLGEKGGKQLGMMITPQNINLNDFNTKLAVSRKQFDIFNTLVQDGATKLINFGKNTQWAGRQITVGLTVPLVTWGTQMSKIFREVNVELTRFQKVYGSGLMSSADPETLKMTENVKQLAIEFSKTMGIAAKDTASLAADLAATGAEGEKLLASLRETTRLAVLGDVSNADAMKTTLSLTNAFKIKTNELAHSVDFLNAVENQTSLSLQDLTAAIPKAGPVVKALGGDVKDLSLMMVALKEGGISAAEGANAVKSAMASMINPTTKAKKVAKEYGIDVEGIVKANKGQLMPTIIAFKQQLELLNDFGKSQVIENIFGKYQFARISALFDNLDASGSQTRQVMDLMGKSAKDLAANSYMEMDTLMNSGAKRFQRATESIKAQFIDIGGSITSAITPIIENVSKKIGQVIKFFEKLPAPVKSFLKVAAGLAVIAGPIIMIAGVFANFLGYVTKGAMSIVNLGRKMAGVPVDKFKMLDDTQLMAQKSTDALSMAFDQQKTSVEKLNAVLEVYKKHLGDAITLNPGFVNQQVSAQTTTGQPPVAKFQTGGSAWVPGSGNGDKVPAMLEPGEYVVNKKAASQHSGLLDEINFKQAPRFQTGGRINGYANKSFFGDAKFTPEDLQIALKSWISPMMTGLRPFNDPLKRGGIQPYGERYPGFFADIFNQSMTPQENKHFMRAMQFDKKGGNWSPTAGSIMEDIQMAQNGTVTSPRLGYSNAPFSHTTTRFTSFSTVQEAEFYKRFMSMFDKPKNKRSAESRAAKIESGQIFPYLLDLWTGKGNGINGIPVSDLFQGQTQYGNEGETVLPGGIKMPITGYGQDIASRMLMLHSVMPGATKTINGKEVPIFQTGGRVNNYADQSLLETLRDWQSNPQYVRQDPERTGQILSALSPIQQSMMLRRKTELGVPGEMPKAQQLMILKAIESGNFDKVLGKEFSFSGKFSSYTDKGLDWLSNKEFVPSKLREMFFKKDSQKNIEKWYAGMERAYEQYKSKDSMQHMLGKLYLTRDYNFGNRNDEVDEEAVIQALTVGKQRSLASSQKEIDAARPFGMDPKSVILQRMFQSGSRMLDVSSASPDGTHMGNPLNEGEWLAGKGKGTLDAVSQLWMPPDKFIGGQKAYDERKMHMPMLLNFKQMGGRINNYESKSLMPEKFATRMEDINAVLAATHQEATTGEYSSMPLTDIGQKISGMGGFSSVIPGANGIYEIGGKKYVVKTHNTAQSARIEAISSQITRDLFGLDSPAQELIKFLHPETSQHVFGVRSPFEERFGKTTNNVGVEHFFTQALAAIIRGDSDLQPDNLFDGMVVDQGAGYAADRASQPRSLTGKKYSVLDQARVNFLMQTGASKKWFTQATAGLAAGMTDEQYTSGFLNAIAQAQGNLPRAMANIEKFGLTPQEKAIYGLISGDLEAAKAINWAEIRQHHAGVTVPIVKPKTQAAIDKAAAKKITDKAELQQALAAGFPEWMLQGGNKNASTVKSAASGMGAQSKSLVTTFARMNPPHAGHGILLDEAANYAKQIGADFRFSLSLKEGDAKNPFSVSEKYDLFKMMFPQYVGNLEPNSGAKGIKGQIEEWAKAGYNQAHLFLGSDQVPKFGNFFPRQAKDFGIDAFVHSVGRTEGGMSATQLREAIASGNINALMPFIPAGLPQSQKMAIANKLMGKKDIIAGFAEKAQSRRVKSAANGMAFAHIVPGTDLGSNINLKYPLGFDVPSSINKTLNNNNPLVDKKELISNFKEPKAIETMKNAFRTFSKKYPESSIKAGMETGIQEAAINTLKDAEPKLNDSMLYAESFQEPLIKQAFNEFKKYEYLAGFRANVSPTTLKEANFTTDGSWDKVENGDILTSPDGKIKVRVKKVGDRTKFVDAETGKINMLGSPSQSSDTRSLTNKPLLNYLTGRGEFSDRINNFADDSMIIRNHTWAKKASAPKQYEGILRTLPDWATKGTEAQAILAALQSAGVSGSDRLASYYVQDVLAHINPTSTNTGEVYTKVWEAANLMKDSQLYNVFLETIKTRKDIQSRGGLVAPHVVEAVMAQTGLPQGIVIQELQSLSNGKHPNTRQGAMVMLALARIFPQSTKAGRGLPIGVAAGLQARLQGNFYETLQSRELPSNLPTVKVVATNTGTKTPQSRSRTTLPGTPTMPKIVYPSMAGGGDRISGTGATVNVSPDGKILSSTIDDMLVTSASGQPMAVSSRELLAVTPDGKVAGVTSPGDEARKKIVHPFGTSLIRGKNFRAQSAADGTLPVYMDNIQGGSMTNFLGSLSEMTGIVGQLQFAVSSFTNEVENGKQKWLAGIELGATSLQKIADSGMGAFGERLKTKGQEMQVQGALDPKKWRGSLQGGLGKAASGIGGAISGIGNFLGGPVGQIALQGTIALINKGVETYNAEMEKAAKAGKAAFAEPTETAKYLGIQLKSLTGDTERYAKFAESMFGALGKGAYDIGYSKVVKKDYGDLIDVVRNTNTEQEKSNQLMTAYSNLIMKGMDPKNAKQVTAEIARQSGSLGAYLKIKDQFGKKDTVRDAMANEQKTLQSQIDILQKRRMQAETTKDYSVNADAVNKAVFGKNQGTWWAKALTGTSLDRTSLVQWMGKSLIQEQTRKQIAVQIGQTLQSAFSIAAQDPKASNDATKAIIAQFKNADWAKLGKEVSQIAEGLGFGATSNIGQYIADTSSEGFRNAGNLSQEVFLNALKSGLGPEIEKMLRDGYLTYTEQALISQKTLEAQSAMKIDFEVDLQIDQSIKQMDDLKAKVQDTFDAAIAVKQKDLDAEDKRHDKALTNLDKEAEKIGKKKDLLQENTDYYLKELQREKEAEDYYAKQRETAIGGLKSLASGDVFGFIGAQQQAASQADQFGRDRSIQNIQDTADEEQKKLDNALKGIDDRKKAEDDRHKAETDNINKEIEFLQKKRALTVGDINEAVKLLEDAKAMGPVQNLDKKSKDVYNKKIAQAYAKAGTAIDDVKAMAGYLPTKGGDKDTMTALKKAETAQSKSLAAFQNDTETAMQYVATQVNGKWKVIVGGLTTASKKIFDETATSLGISIGTKLYQAAMNNVIAGQNSKAGVYGATTNEKGVTTTTKGASDLLTGALTQFTTYLQENNIKPPEWSQVISKGGMTDGMAEYNSFYEDPNHPGKFWRLDKGKNFKGTEGYHSEEQARRMAGMGDYIYSWSESTDGKYTELPRLKDGGPIYGAGTSRSDSIPAMLSNGEFVVNANAAQNNMGLLHSINNGDVPRFGWGGWVGDIFDSVKNKVTSTVSSVGKTVSSAIHNPGAFIKNTVQSGIQAAKNTINSVKKYGPTLWNGIKKVGSYVADNFLGVDDFRSMYNHFKKGEWGAGFKSLGTGVLELGGTALMFVPGAGQVAMAAKIANLANKATKIGKLGKVIAGINDIKSMAKVGTEAENVIGGIRTAKAMRKISSMGSQALKGYEIYDKANTAILGTNALYDVATGQMTEKDAEVFLSNTSRFGLTKFFKKHENLMGLENGITETINTVKETQSEGSDPILSGVKDIFSKKKSSITTEPSSSLNYFTKSLFASGGHISGPGGPRSDVIPAMLSNGEFVVQADAVSKYGVPFMNAINSKKYANGGGVGVMPRTSVPSSPTYSIPSTPSISPSGIASIAQYNGGGYAEGNSNNPTYHFNFNGAGMDMVMGHVNKAMGGTINNNSRGVYC